MPDRMNNQVMPPVEIVDMREELHAGNRTMFSKRLLGAIEERLAKKRASSFILKQTGIFYFCYVSRMWGCSEMSTL